MEGLDAAGRRGVLAVLAEAGVQDERLYAALVALLNDNVQSAAMDLASYGDPRAILLLERALVAVRLDEDDNLFGAGQDVIELVAAIEHLGGEVSTAGRAQRAKVVAMRDATFGSLRRALAAPRKTAKVGRNDPCPCGSGKKHRKRT
jgi:hypothetical protein